MDKLNERARVFGYAAIDLDNLLAIHTELGHRLVGLEATQEIVDSVEHCRREALQKGVVAHHPLGAHNVVALKGLPEKGWQILGLVLQVAVNHGDIVALGV